MWADPSTAVCCMLSPFLVITPIKAKYSVSKDSTPRAPVTIGITQVFVFQFQYIFNAKLWYFDIFSAFLSLTLKIPRYSHINDERFLIFLINEHNIMVSSLYNMVGSDGKIPQILCVLVSHHPSTLCSYQFLADSKPYLLHSSQWTIVVTLSWRYLYSVGCA